MGDLRSVANALKSETETKLNVETGNSAERGVVRYMGKVGVMTVVGGVVICAAAKYCGRLQKTSAERVDATLPVGLLLSLSGMSLFQRAPPLSGAMVAVGVRAIASAVAPTKAMPLSQADATLIVLFAAAIYWLF